MADGQERNGKAGWFRVHPQLASGLVVALAVAACGLAFRHEAMLTKNASDIEAIRHSTQEFRAYMKDQFSDIKTELLRIRDTLERVTPKG